MVMNQSPEGQKLPHQDPFANPPRKNDYSHKLGKFYSVESRTGQQVIVRAECFNPDDETNIRRDYLEMETLLHELRDKYHIPVPNFQYIIGHHPDTKEPTIFYNR